VRYPAGERAPNATASSPLYGNTVAFGL
jgi:hypothetical protein